MELSKFILTSKLYAFNRFIGYVSLKNKEKELFSALSGRISFLKLTWMVWGVGKLEAKN
jgi:hypothetical protein